MITHKRYQVNVHAFCGDSNWIETAAEFDTPEEAFAYTASTTPDQAVPRADRWDPGFHVYDTVEYRYLMYAGRLVIRRPNGGGR